MVKEKAENQKGGSGMSNTAVSAQVQGTDNTHRVFRDEEHEKFY